ncbi:hypothetical protein O0B36_10120 [Staphylococcus pseudintermedius]|nr:hypothetical protein [Staphylococcus pseudintermedius]
MWCKTKVTEQCQIDYPIIHVGNDTRTRRNAVSELGGVATIGAGYMTSAVLE